MRGLAARLSALYDQNFRAAFAQCNREREPNDPATDDDNVPSFHMGIVKDWTAALACATQSLLRNSTTSGWLQSTGPMNLRRITPLRSMM